MAEMMSRGLASCKRKHGVDWFTREGIVFCNHNPNNNLMIKWDGRKSLDAWPERALEKV